MGRGCSRSCQADAKMATDLYAGDIVETDYEWVNRTWERMERENPEQRILGGRVATPTEPPSLLVSRTLPVPALSEPRPVAPLLSCQQLILSTEKFTSGTTREIPRGRARVISNVKTIRKGP